jgi:hypothetical protein
MTTGTPALQADPFPLGVGCESVVVDAPQDCPGQRAFLDDSDRHNCRGYQRPRSRSRHPFERQIRLRIGAMIDAGRLGVF